MDTATTESYPYGHTLSLPDALPISQSPIPNPLSGARSATLMPKAWHGSLRRVRRGAWYAVAIVLVVMALVAGIVSQVLLPWAERHPERIEAWPRARAERSVRFDHVETQWQLRGPRTPPAGRTGARP